MAIVERARRRAPEAPARSASLADFGAKPVFVDRPAANAFDVIESKLLVPEVRPDSVVRTALVNRLRAAGAFPVVLVVAPAGYGKTTLLAQWAAKDARPFAWLSLDERDNDPVVLMRHLAAALDRVDAVDPAIAEKLATPGISIWDTVIPRLTKHLAAQRSPFVLVVDDADLLETAEAIRALTVVIQNVPPRSIIALAGRAQPALPVAALRVDAPLLELGSYELALSRREAELLLRACAVDLPDDAVGELVERTEGWATGLYLAALAAGDRGVPGGASLRQGEFCGDDRDVTDYLESEYLVALDEDLRRFLVRTSILDKLSAPLCDAVLTETGSAAALAQLEKLNLFIVPLDRHREWYRYHQLFRELLQRELATSEPELVAELNARAAEWYEAEGDQESALGHAHAAGDADRAARILSSIALDVHDSGRASAVESWLRRFDEGERLEDYPAVAIHGCRIHAVRGRPEEAERWLVAAERGVSSHRKGVAAVRPWIAAMRSGMCSDGPKRMRLDAEAARAKLPRGANWRPSALLFEGAAAILLGEPEKADAILADAALTGERLGSAESLVIALAERSLLASAREDHDAAESLALDACGVIEQNQLDDYATSSLAIVASARALLRHGLWDKARRQLALAENILPGLTYVLPWLAVQVRLELGHAYVTLRDREAAQRMLAEAHEILSLKPKLGVLRADVEGLASEISAMPAPVGGRSSGLTSAELRLLPLLATHLSFREIGERLFVSRNTIKTQAISVYRKLGVSSRSEAIERAVELGLVEAEDQLALRRTQDGVVPLAAS